MALISLFLSQMAMAMTVNPAPFPVFLKQGYSSILEFKETPTQVVLGDQNLFQVEKLDHSLVIKPLVTYATTNMFVYFKAKETRLFILTASEDNEPTYFKKFTSVLPPKSDVTESNTRIHYVRGASIRKSAFDRKKDYLTVDFDISADSTGKVTPNWDQIRLKYKDRFISPSKLWSERREAQRDSKIKSRLIFMKPNVPADLRDVSIVVPVKGSAKSFTVSLKAGRL